MVWVIGRGCSHAIGDAEQVAVWLCNGGNLGEWLSVGRVGAEGGCWAFPAVGARRRRGAGGQVGALLHGLLIIMGEGKQWAVAQRGSRGGGAVATEVVGCDGREVESCSALSGCSQRPQDVGHGRVEAALGELIIAQGYITGGLILGSCRAGD